jgi:hypothetical protein
MALFTDGNPADIDYLREFDAAVLDVASQESIDLDNKLALAADEIGDEILAFVIRQGRPDQQLQHRLLGMSAVVVSNALRRWHALHTLELFYRDAYNNQLNDRYGGRCEQYAALAEEASKQLYELGLGMVCSPVPAPPGPTVVGQATGDDKPTYYFRATYVTDQGVESQPCAVGNGGLVSTDQLTIAPGASASVTGWNLYFGVSADELYLQNTTPLAIAAAWTFDGTFTSTGKTPGAGQSPDYYLIDRGILQRG